MINYLGKEGEEKLANSLYYGGGAVGKAQRNQGERTGSLLGNQENKTPLTDEQKETRNANLGTGLGMAGAAISALDDDPEYGNADVASSALNMAAMGASAGPIGAAVGGAIGLGVGLIKKGKEKKKRQKEEEIKREKEQLAEDTQNQAVRAEGYQNGGEIDFTHAGHSQYQPPIGYGSGFTGPNESGGIYERTRFTAPEGGLKIPEGLQVKPETAFKLASRFIDPAKMPDLSIYSDNTKTPRPRIGISEGQYEDYSVRMQKSGMSVSNLDDMSLGNYNTGGMTKGAYSHKTNPLAVVDKNGNHTGMELTGGEGVFDKPAMEKIKRMVAGGQFKEAGVFVNNEMKTWKHK